MNYKSLANPFNTTLEQNLLGQKVFIRRLSSDELLAYSEAVDKERAGEKSDRSLSLMAANLFISALVNEDGSRPHKKELPTAADLLAVHSSADLLTAVTTVQRHSYGTLEDAVKN